MSVFEKELRKRERRSGEIVDQSTLYNLEEVMEQAVKLSRSI